MDAKVIHISSVPNTDQFYPAEIEIVGDIFSIFEGLNERLNEDKKWEQKTIDAVRKELYKTITPAVMG